MSQIAIVDFLKENSNRWFTAKEINDVLKDKRGNLNDKLRQLRKFRFIEAKWNESSPKYYYEYKYRT